MTLTERLNQPDMRFLARCQCPKCKKDMGHSGSMPCPHCGKKSKVKEQPVVKPGSKPKKADPKLVSVIYTSKSRPDQTHEVRCTRKGVFVSCSCEGYFYRKNCWHKDDFLFNKGRKGKKV